MRTIYADVNGFELKLSSKSGGVQGEKNATVLQVRVDDSWAGLGKRIVWRDATGENPVPVVLFDPMGEDGDPLSYAAAIPAAALAYPGWCSFTLEGYAVRDGHWVKAMGAVGALEVRASEIIYQPEDDTPSQTQQILAALGETEQRIFDIGQEVRADAREAKSWAVGGTDSREGEDKDNAKYYAERGAEDAEEAKQSAQAAEAAGKNAAGSATAAAESAKTAGTHAVNAGKQAERAQQAARDADTAVDTGKRELGKIADTASGYAAEAAKAREQAQNASAAAGERSQAAAGSASAARAAAAEATAAATASIAAAQAAEETVRTAAAEAARDAETKARSWAVGGTGSREDENTDNAKYYAGRAGADAAEAKQSAQTAWAAVEAEVGLQVGAAAAVLPVKRDWLHCYGAGTFAAVINGSFASGEEAGTAAWSDDGMVFHQSQMPQRENGWYSWYDICEGNGVFVAVGRDYQQTPYAAGSAAAFSTDRGRTWQLATFDQTLQGALGAVCFDGTRFVTVGQYLRYGAAYSEDGEHWTCDPDAFTAPGSGTTQRLCAGNGMCLAVSYSQSTAQVLRRGKTAWEAVELPESGYHQWRGCCFGMGRFVLVSGDGAILTSRDLKEFSIVRETSALDAPVGEKMYLYDVCYGKGRFVAVGADGENGAMGNPTAVWSADGESWHPVRIPDLPEEAMSRWYRVCAGDGLFLTSDYGKLAWSMNGADWFRNAGALKLADGTDVTGQAAEALKPYFAWARELPEGGEPFSYLSRTEDGQGAEWVQRYPEIPIVNAVSEDGAAYTAAVEGVTELKTGMLLTIIPNMTSTSTTVKLNVNGLGEKELRRPGKLSSHQLMHTAANWLRSNRPVLLQYNGAVWIAVALTRPSADDLSGIVPIAHGGTGYDSWDPYTLVWINAQGEFDMIYAPETADCFLYSPGPNQPPDWAYPEDIRAFLGCLPDGGSAGQFLQKRSATAYDAGWVTVTNGNEVSY